MELKIVTLKWSEDDAVREDGTVPTATRFCRVFIDGVELPAVLGATASYSSEWALATVQFCPGSVEVVECDQAEWDALGPIPT